MRGHEGKNISYCHRATTKMESTAYFHNKSGLGRLGLKSRE